MAASSVNSMALVLHKLGDNVAAVVHEITHDAKGRLLFGAGKPITRKDEQEVIALLSGNKPPRSGFIPARVLSFDSDLLVWHRPAHTTVINMEGTEYTVQIPALVFRLSEGKLRIATAKNLGRPKPTTTLYHCGLPNVYQHGYWCSGGNVLPTKAVPSDIDRIERMFFESPFTHHLGSPLSCVEDQWEFWIHDDRRKRFPNKVLLPIQNDRRNHLTVAEFIVGEDDE